MQRILLTTDYTTLDLPVYSPVPHDEVIQLAKDIFSKVSIAKLVIAYSSANVVLWDSSDDNAPSIQSKP